MMQVSPKVSVIVPLDEYLSGHRQRHRPRDTLGALCDQTLAPSLYEVLFIGTRMMDLTTECGDLLEDKPAELSVTYHRIPSGGRAAACNRGARESSAPLLLFLADDFLPVRNLVAEHLTVHERHPQEHIVVLGPTVFPEDIEISPFMRWLEDSGKLFGVPFSRASAAIPDGFFYGANVSLKRSFFNAAGGCDERFLYAAWDDYDLGIRLRQQGMQVVFAPAALAYHYHVITLPERCELIELAGESAWIFDSKHPGPHPWHRQVGVPPGVRALAALGTGLIHFLSGRERDRRLYFQRTLNAAFVRGYRRAKGRTPASAEAYS